MKTEMAIICTYHKKSDEKWIENLMLQYGFNQFKTSSGFMILDYGGTLHPKDALRRGVLFVNK